jgi:hypothetical protein
MQAQDEPVINVELDTMDIHQIVNHAFVMDILLFVMSTVDIATIVLQIQMVHFVKRLYILLRTSPSHISQLIFPL